MRPLNYNPARLIPWKVDAPMLNCKNSIELAARSLVAATRPVQAMIGADEVHTGVLTIPPSGRHHEPEEYLVFWPTTLPTPAMRRSPNPLALSVRPGSSVETHLWGTVLLARIAERTDTRYQLQHIQWYLPDGTESRLNDWVHEIWIRESEERVITEVKHDPQVCYGICNRGRNLEMA